MRRGGLRVLLLATALTVSWVAYAVLRPSKPGDVPFAQWAAQQGLPMQAIAEQCATVNETATGRAWCFRQQTAQAGRQWRRSQAGVDERWAAADPPVSRDLLLVVGAYMLFVLVIGCLMIKVVLRLIWFGPG